MEQSNPTNTIGLVPQPTPKHIFILAGESNMAGRGGVDMKNHWNVVIPPQCVPDPTKIYRLNADLRWEVATEPLHYDIDNKKTCGVGPGMAFANSIKYLVVGEIGLVPCAVGETAIKEWGRGTPLYAKMVERAKATTATTTPTPTPTATSTSTPTPTPTSTSTATATSTSTATSLVTATSASTATSTNTASPTSTKTASPTPTATLTATAIGGGVSEIKALLWYQGESDTKSDDDANCYKEKMEKLIANIRADLNLPRLPVIQVAIASGYATTTIEKIRKVQLEMKVENAVCVDAKDLTLKEHSLHLTTEGQVQLGHMLALDYLKHFKG